MDSENLENKKSQKKAEESLQNKIDPIENKSKDELIQELHTHQIELEMQNEELRKSHTRLEESRRKYFELYNFAPVGYFTLDENGLILESNLTGAELLNIERINLNKKSFIQYIAKEDRNKFHHHLYKVIKTGTKQKIDIKLIKSVDNSFYAHIETIIQSKNENLKEFRITVTDIDAIKNTQEQFQRLANVVESSDDAIITKSLEGKILSWNKGAEHIYGYSAQEAIGKPISIIVPTNLKKEINEFIEKIEKNEKINHYETERLRKDGKLINVSVTLSPVFDSSNNLFAISNISRDITENKKSSKALELASKYNRNLIEASIDPLVTIGPDGKITDVNKATETVTGFSIEDLIGTDFSNYFTNPKKAQSGYKKVFKEGSVHDYPLEIKHKNGRLTSVMYNASVYKDETGEIIGVFASARDITEMKKAEDKLKEYQDTLEEKVKNRTKELAKSNVELEHFAHVASHDLREPLRMITNFLQLLEKRYTDQLDDDAKEFIGYAVDGAKRLNNMINDLLSYSQVTRTESEFGLVNLEKVLEQTLINLSVQIEDNNAVITHDSLPNIIGNEKLLVNLFQNLIGNAIKYHREEIPNVHISGLKETHHYLFSVKDNGIGIDSEHLNRIFTIFQRLNRMDEYEGTGIGLSIAQKIVEQHGGEIWVESEIGKGSIFYFTIPF